MPVTWNICYVSNEMIESVVDKDLLRLSTLTDFLTSEVVRQIRRVRSRFQRRSNQFTSSWSSDSIERERMISLRFNHSTRMSYLADIRQAKRQ